MIVLSTTPDEKIANKLAKELVDKKAAACVNCIKDLKSFYTWKNEVQNDSEVLMMIKGNYKKIKDVILKNHPYETPEVIAIKPKKIEKSYKKWLEKSTKISPMLVGTRLNNNEEVSCVSLSEALLQPAAKHGGLYAPINLPILDDNFFKKASKLKYDEIAMMVIKKFKFDIDKDIFKKALKRYAKFDKEAVEIKKLNKNLYINELWHGPTRAFKDMALQPFGVILKELAKQNNKKYLIMCATSGDTGPATLNTFSDVQNIKVVCIYPKDGTSEVQRLQMVNQKGKNLKSIGIKGNFDDAQKALKALLNDKSFKNELSNLGLNLSAANSVNFGRILFQIIYHIYVCIKINSNKKPIDIVVPSGNFGNALGAYYAKKMGANVGKIKIASNANNILTELFTTGIYNLQDKKLIQTISPAMDILISSNVERLLFDKFGSIRTKELMDSLKNSGFYKLAQEELEELKADFEADFCSDEECENYIKNVSSKGILIDPHTATCLKLVDNDKLSVITSTAQWVKFTPSMVKAIKNKPTQDELVDMKELAKEFDVKIPKSILELFSQKELHKDVIEQDKIKSNIINWLKK
ncbi:threonine synthase [Campylobacter fetus]|uniref:Threonine synthase n=1 Tax=Campylobacter fetus TaxID=196 RepID=A0A5L4IIK5_CAMFE|nr:threonine synthase [Campylobacter fetus]EAI4414072.1 threonine synthase [Campylobacter fetus]EAK0415280.1 threonine synthase [Campylobacter fetus]EAK0452266.1 threonine synthase [Campylobacter fetus]EAL3874684.1 threonine synthase [Campylobacter fetus]EGK8152080.1 threonine synthase [Campylobacter fetus]